MLLWSVFILRNNLEYKSTEADTEEKKPQKSKTQQRSIADHTQGLSVVRGIMQHNTAATEESNDT